MRRNASAVCDPASTQLDGSSAGGTNRRRELRRSTLVVYGIWAWIIGIVALACTVSPAAAQSGAERIPTVFQHGIRSDRTAWATTAGGLESVYPIRPRRESLDWTTPYSDQAAELISRIGSLADTGIAIGHSNGGHVLRRAARTGLHARSLITVGSPNTGAPAAYNVGTGMFQAWAYSYVGEIETLFLTLSGYEADGWEEALTASILTVGTALLTTELAINALSFDADYPIWSYMYPGSSYMTEANGAAAIAAEQANVLDRVAIVSSVSRGGIGNPVLSQVAPGDIGTNSGVFIGGFALLSLISSHYYAYCPTEERWGEPYAYQKCAGALLAADLSARIATLDYQWCDLITFPLSSVPRYGSSGCGDSDGVVPVIHQGLPDASFQRVIPGGPAHTRQTTDPSVRQALADVIQSRYGAAQCGNGPAYRTRVQADSTVLAIGESAVVRADVLDRCDVPTVASLGATFASETPGILSISSATSQQAVVSAVAAGYGSVQVSGPGGPVSVPIRVLELTALSGSLVGSSGCCYPINEIVRLSVANIRSGSAPVSVQWYVDGAYTGVDGPEYFHTFRGDVIVTAILRNPAGGEKPLSIGLLWNGQSIDPARVDPRPKAKKAKAG